MQDAISYLGTTMLKNLVMSVSLWRSLEEARPEAISRLQRVHTRCQRVAMLSRKIMGTSRARAEEAFVAGLLHDIGETLLIVYLPERYERPPSRPTRRARRCTEAERELYGVDHAELGAHLLDAWGLPFPVLEAVAFHHSAPELEHTSLETADAVYIAETLLCARARRAPIRGGARPGLPRAHRRDRTTAELLEGSLERGSCTRCTNMCLNSARNRR